MKHDTLIFDLDGTISDPKEGIVKSINHALQCFDFEPRSEMDIARFIGPPMDKTFELLTGIVDTRLTLSLIANYRERYADIGYAENVLYEGMRETLMALHGERRLVICTSKRVDFATKILEMFGLVDLFDVINGGDVGIEKWQQLQAMLDDDQISKQSLMIGDRYIDLTAADANNLNAAGVLWGYGTKQELLAEKPLYLFKSPQQLMQLVR